jgi:serine/threonine protein kinase
LQWNELFTFKTNSNYPQRYHLIIKIDLKTQNILLDENYRGIISDFGISKYLNEHLSSTTIQKGSPLYQSPGK